MTNGWVHRFLPHLRARANGVAALAALAVVGVGLDALLPWPLKLIVDHVLAGQPMPASMSWLTALPGAESAVGALAWLAAAVLGIYLAAQGLQLVRGIVQADLGARLQYALAAQVFDRLQSLALTFHRRARTGDLVRRITADTGCLPTLVTGVLVPAFTSVLALVVLFAIMWQLDATLTLVALLVVLPMAMVMRSLGPRMTERAYEHQEAEGAVWSVAEQTLTAIPVVQAFGREEHERTRFQGVAAQSMRAYLRTIRTQIQFRLGVDGAEAAGVAAIMVIGGAHVIAGKLTVGSLIVFLSYLAALYAPLLAFAYLATTVASAAGSAQRVAQILDSDEIVNDDPGASPLRPAAGVGRGTVRFEGVVFGYQPGKPVLHDIDLEIRPGETISLVGPSGAGKSTLVALIPRLLDPWEGRVLISGRDVRTATLASVRESVAMVLQEPFLLPASVADNIRYARPSATQAEIVAAARAANAEEFIGALPRGYDTLVGERGAALSGGQRQRLAIARALLRDAPILIMDEPTSALDVEAEQAVLQAVERLMAGRTTIVIAHRLSTARRADRIAVLDQGMITGCGAHEGLLASNALYRSLFAVQATSGREAVADAGPRG